MSNIQKLDLNLLVVLEAIYSEGGVTRAAEKLNLTQPAISHALSRLRATFSDPLFFRQGRGLVPTPLTRSLIEPLRRSLRGLGTLLNEAGRFDPREAQTTFTLAMRDPVEILALPPLLRYLAGAAPGVDLRAVQVARRNIEAGLASGALDLAFDILLPFSDAVRRGVVSETDLVLTMPKRYAAWLNAGFGNRVLPLPLAAPMLDLYVYWHDAVDRDLANRWLRMLVIESFAA